MALIRSALRLAPDTILTPQRVKSEVTHRLDAQAERLRRLAVSERIRDDYQLQDDRMAGRR